MVDCLTADIEGLVSGGLSYCRHRSWLMVDCLTADIVASCLV